MSSNDYERLISEAAELPRGAVKVGLLEEAVRLADVDGDTKNGFRARMKLIDAAVAEGYDDKGIAAFSWCLALYDRRPDDFNGWERHSLHWMHKWIINILPDFPTVSRAKIAEMLDDYERRFREAGYGMQQIYRSRLIVASALGDEDDAVEWYRQYRASPDDGMTNCIACETSLRSWFHFYRGHDKRGLNAAKRILDGNLSCRSVPHTTIANVLMPLHESGRTDEAMRHQTIGNRLILRQSGFLQTAAKHIPFLIVTDQIAKAMRIFERCVPEALASRNPDDRFMFFKWSAALFEWLAHRGDRLRRLRTPKTFPVEASDGRFRPTEVANWFADQTRDLAERFDARNGNDGYMRRIREARETIRLPL